MQLTNWARQNLGGNWLNICFTLFAGFLIWQGAIAGISWWGQAQWSVIADNFRLFAVGRYPADQDWRLWWLLWLTMCLAGAGWGRWGRWRRDVAVAVVAGFTMSAIAFPVDLRSRLAIITAGALVFAGFWVGQCLKRWHYGGITLAIALLAHFPIAIWLIGGGWGLTPVSSNLWNGFLLTILLAQFSIFFSFPIGALLALGRQSDLPVINWLSRCYIEVMRGLPLVGILFMAQVLLPLFLPQGIVIERVWRAIAGFVLFTSAYVAEYLRGGLQAIPQGQVEAAQSLGLNAMQINMLIIFPQALRIAIPGLAGQFISLFKDTSLVAIVGMVDLMGISRSILANPNYLGRYAEVYLFVGAVYGLIAYGMAWVSYRLEQSIHA